ncbi:MAG: hypothetical protein ACJ74W_22645 [Pyrinomonadaceae bacterium]
MYWGTENGKETGLVGSVKSVQIEVANYLNQDNESIISAQQLQQIINYDINGRKIEELNYDINNVSSKSLFSYDPEGKLTQVVISAKSNSLIRKSQYTYESHKVVQIDFDSMGTIIGKIIQILNENGQLQEAYHYDDSGQPLIKILPRYDDKGALTEIAFYTCSLQPTIALQKQGNNEQVTWREAKDFTPINHNNGLLLSRYVFERSQDGRIRQENIYDNLDVQTKKIISHFDQADNIIEFIEYGPDNSLLNRETFDYEYDFNGNWIVQVKSKLNDSNSIEPFTILYRTITYY